MQQIFFLYTFTMIKERLEWNETNYNYIFMIIATLLLFPHSFILSSKLSAL